MFEFGYIVGIRPADGYVRVYFPELDITTEFIPVVKRFAKGNRESIPVTVNDTMLCGRTHSGRWFVLGAITNDINGLYDGANPSKSGTEYADGAFFEYDIENSKFTLHTDGDIEVKGGTLKVEAETTLEIKAANISLLGAVAITGALSATAGLSISGGDIEVADGGSIKAGTISLTDHKHTGVQPGGGLSGGPL